MEKIAVAVISFLITIVVTPVAIYQAKKRGWVDLPNERKVHKVPMPRVGGLGILAGIVAGMVLTSFFESSTWTLWLLIPVVLISLMGFMDDVKGLSFKTKFLVQIVASVLAVLFVGVNISEVTNPFNHARIEFGPLGPVVTVIWIVGITNAVNLSDGLDGLAAGLSAISALTLAVTSAKNNMAAALISLSVFSSALAFLKYNFHPAKTFMGDTGSQLLGFILAVIAVKGSSLSASTLSLAIPLLAIGVPILDTVYAFVRRMVRGGNPFLPDKMHIHHQLLNIGFSHVQAVLFMYAVSSGLAAIAILYRGKHELTLLASYSFIAIALLAFLKVMRVRASKRNGRRKHG